MGMERVVKEGLSFMPLDFESWYSTPSCVVVVVVVPRG